jgi:hypothetical protein
VHLVCTFNAMEYAIERVSVSSPVAFAFPLLLNRPLLNEYSTERALFPQGASSISLGNAANVLS